METIQNILNKKRIDVSDASMRMKTKRVYITKNNNGKIEALLTYLEFKKMMYYNATLILRKRNVSKKYIIDNRNEFLIKELYLYSVGSSHFKGDLNKGIFIKGSIGTGKTVIIKAFIQIIEDLTHKRIIQLHSQKIASFLKEKGNEYLDKRPLYVEDIGKETKEINDFGTKKFLIPEIFNQRYENGAWTFCCSNYKDASLTDFYGQTISDRFNEMFNFFELTGETMRK